MAIFARRSLGDVLGGLDVPVADPAAVSTAIVATLALRRRRRRLAAAAAAAVALLVGASALAMGGSESPTEVVSADAPADDSGTTTTTTTLASATGSGTVVTAVPTTTAVIAPGVTAPVTVTIPPPAPLPPPPGPNTGQPAPAPGRGAPPTGPSSPPPPTTAPDPPSDSPVVATLGVSPAKVGEVVSVELEWSDQDAPGNSAVELWVTAVSGGEQIGSRASRPGSCDGPSPAGGTVSTGLRLPRAGTWELYVDVSICGAENVRFDDTVAIADPGGGRRGVIVLADGFDPEQGTWTYYAQGDTKQLRSDSPSENDPSVRMVRDGKPVTVLAVPGGAGTLRHTSTGCREVTVPDTAPAVIEMMGPCVVS